jgi:hypothetical protein
MFPPLLVLSCKHSLDPIAGFEHMRLVCWHAVEEKSKPESLMNIRTWPWSITLDGSSMMNSSNLHRTLPQSHHLADSLHAMLSNCQQPSCTQSCSSRSRSTHRSSSLSGTRLVTIHDLCRSKQEMKPFASRAVMYARNLAHWANTYIKSSIYSRSSCPLSPWRLPNVRVTVMVCLCADGPGRQHDPQSIFKQTART